MDWKFVIPMALLLLSQVSRAQNNALHFDGVNDQITILDNGQIEFGASENFSIEFWTRIPTTNQETPTGNTSNSIIEKWNGAGGYPYAFRYLNHLHVNPGKLEVSRFDGTQWSSLQSTINLNDDAWHHIAFVKDGAVLNLYIDGILDTTGVDNSTGTTTNSVHLHLGRRGDPANFHHWKGTLDQLRIWNDARTATEIEALMSAEAVGNEANLVALYHFNSGTPGGNNAGQFTLEDATANANDGALIGFSLYGSQSNYVTSNGTTTVSGAGIGTDSPNAQLHVKGSSWTTMTIEAAANDPVLQLTNNGSDVNNDWTIRMDADQEQSLLFRMDDVDVMRLFPAGYVGIGTNQPSTFLEVSGYSYENSVIKGINSAQGSYGVFGQSTSTSGGAGVVGESMTTSGFGLGVAGLTHSTIGRGVLGLAESTTGTTYGVVGEVHSPSGVGTYGRAFATTGPARGVHGLTSSTTGTGVFGETNSSSGMNYGVHGKTVSTSGIGVFGEAAATTGATYGVYGKVTSTSGTAVYGEATTSSGITTGVFGKSSSNSGSGVSGEASATTGGVNGVRGLTPSVSGRGVFGYAIASSGTTFGVLGWADSPSGRGVSGNVIGESAFALYGFASGIYGKGLYAEVTSTHSSANAILAIAPGAGSAYAGYFAGRVHVAGTLSKSAGSFKIDHPLDPENKYLFHSFVESPDMMNIYNGNITTGPDGFATVLLPDYFDALNIEFRYQLTVIGTFSQAIIAEEILGNQFRIQTDKPGVKVSWMVTGIRNDAFAKSNRIQPEVNKEPENRGKYLHPEIYNQPRSSAIHYQEPVGDRRTVQE